MADKSVVRQLLDELWRDGIRDPRVLRALELVPRDLFVPTSCRDQAYCNIPLPIGDGQTISQPYVVAAMTQALELTGNEIVLEVGTGSGYQCAVLAELSRRVVSIERHGHLAVAARELLCQIGYSNIRIEVGDGSLGFPAEAPYDAIVVTAAAPSVPRLLEEQLAEGGRLVLPVGSRDNQELLLYSKREGKMVGRSLGNVRFVPLIGKAAWQEEAAESVLEEWL